MRKSDLIPALVLAVATMMPLRAQHDMPLLTEVAPDTGTYGDVLTVTGQNLDRATVAALYLTDGKNDIKVVIVEQSATSIKFKIPAGMKPGRFALMILTPGKDAKFIEEPVKITVEGGPGPTSSS